MYRRSADPYGEPEAGRYDPGRPPPDSSIEPQRDHSSITPVYETRIDRDPALEATRARSRGQRSRSEPGVETSLGAEPDLEVGVLEHDSGQREITLCVGKPTVGSNPTLSAISSAAAETSGADRGTAPQIPAIPRALAVEGWRIRTGDCGFRAWKAPQLVFVSAARLGGSDSLQVRPSEGRRRTDPYIGMGRVNHPRASDGGEGENLSNFN